MSDFLSGAREKGTLPDGSVTTALKTGSRAQFEPLARERALALGLDQAVPPDPLGGLRDITSENRLGLLFDVQTEQARSFGDWQASMDPNALDEWPAWRFIRVGEPKVRRPLHSMHEGEVRLKTDPAFWERMNDPGIGGFGLPSGPWGFNSLMDVEDVDRDEAERLGLLAPGQSLQPAQRRFNDDLAAGVGSLEPDTLRWILDEAGDTFAYNGQRILRKPRATDPSPRPDDERGRQRSGRREGNDTRRIAEAGIAILRDIRSRDDETPVLAPAFLQSAAAQVSAVAADRKPLYHEERLWTGSSMSALSRILPRSMRIARVGDPLFVYNPVSVASIISMAPEMYPGRNIQEKLLLAARGGSNGILLGYGAASMLAPDTVTIAIRNPQGDVVAGFRTPASSAIHWSSERVRISLRLLARDSDRPSSEPSCPHFRSGTAHPSG